MAAAAAAAASGDNKMAASIAKRFQQAVEKAETTQKMLAILQMAAKNDLMAWTDEKGLDLLHYCILQDNAEAADFLLKHGYFARPHEPAISPYTHLAACLGLRTTLGVLLQHRPDDFRIASQPLLIPPGFPLKKAVVSAGGGGGGRVGGGGGRGGGGGGGDSPRSKISSPRSSGAGTARPVSSAAASRKPAPGTKSADPPSKAYDGEVSSASRNSGTGGITTGTSTTTTRRDSLGGLATDGSEPLMRTPLEVAARARRLDCVRMLLDTCVLKAHPEAPNKGYLTLAALSDHPTALALLLKNTKQDKQMAEDFKAAVEVCVQRALPDCLDLLLGNVPGKVDTKSLFKQINFYHVLYTFSASYGKAVYGRLPEVTRVLIRRGHDVNAKVPPRTYPLYTLLTHAFCYHDYTYTQYYVECLRALLQKGADPNFDEVAFEKRLLEKKGIKFAAGRNAYASALHCLLETVETYASQMSSKSLAVRFVEDCAEVLVKYKADVCKVGRIGDAKSDVQGNVLHQYAKSCVTIGVDKAILQCILRFGAEPDIKVNGKYAINVYFDKLFELLSLCEVVDTRHKYQDDVNKMMTLLCRHMSSAHIKEAAFIFKRSHGRSTSEQVKYYIESVLADFEARSKQVRPLRRQVAWKVWLLCRKRPEAVRSLPVKVELKTLILPLL